MTWWQILARAYRVLWNRLFWKAQDEEAPIVDPEERWLALRLEAVDARQKERERREAWANVKVEPCHVPPSAYAGINVFEWQAMQNAQHEANIGALDNLQNALQNQQSPMAGQQNAYGNAQGQFSGMLGNPGWNGAVRGVASDFSAVARALFGGEY